MKRLISLIVTITVGAGLAACSSATTASGTSERDKVVAVDANSVLARPEGSAHEDLVVSAPPEAVLAALRTVYTDLGIEVKQFNPSTGEIGNLEFVRLHRLGGQRLTDLINCGSTVIGPAADTYRVTMLLVSTVRPEGTGSRVETRFESRGIDPAQGTSAAATVCQSLGTLEQRIYAGLKTKLGQ